MQRTLWNYDAVDWRFISRILDENSIRLSRTRAGISDTSTSSQKRPLRCTGTALRRQSAANEERTYRFLSQWRHGPLPSNGQQVLRLLFRIADLNNEGLLPGPQRLRTWPIPPYPRYSPDGLLRLPTTQKVPPEDLPAALRRYARIICRRWGELSEDPVPLASWAEWELNGGSLHPFYDGCGRVSRAFGAFLLMRAGWLPPLYDNRESYFEQGHSGQQPFAAYFRERICYCAQWLKSQQRGTERAG